MLNAPNLLYGEYEKDYNSLVVILTIMFNFRTDWALFGMFSNHNHNLTWFGFCYGEIIEKIQTKISSYIKKKKNQRKCGK